MSTNDYEELHEQSDGLRSLACALKDRREFAAVINAADTLDQQREEIAGLQRELHEAKLSIEDLRLINREKEDQVIATNSARAKLERRIAALESRAGAVPDVVVDLVRFLASTWTSIDKWAYERAGIDALEHYPVIQGTRNQINLQRIGGQPYSRVKAAHAMALMLTPQIAGLTTTTVAPSADGGE